jgi:hypothetical protein
MLSLDQSFSPSQVLQVLDPVLTSKLESLPDARNTRSSPQIREKSIINDTVTLRQQPFTAFKFPFLLILLLSNRLLRVFDIH